MQFDISAAGSVSMPMYSQIARSRQSPAYIPADTYAHDRFGSVADSKQGP